MPESLHRPETSAALPLESVAPEQDASLSFWHRYWHRLLALAIWALVIGGCVWYAAGTGWNLNQMAYDLMEFLYTPLGPLVYILAFAIRPLTFLSAALLTVLAGSIFGPVAGVAYTIIGSNLSAAVAYLLGRWLGRDLLTEFQSRGMIQRYCERLRRNSFDTVLIMNLLFVPFDLINYLAGLLHIRFRSFLLATFIGSLPGILACVLLGASVTFEMGNGLVWPEPQPWYLVLSALLFLGGLGFSRYFKRREARQQALAEAAQDIS
jgi:uncharacterized membrane protein YdjX (TVP38/TMEM64 family)